MLIAAFSVFTQCKSSKEVGKRPKDEVLIEQYCSGPEYFSDNEYFRANNIGESLEQATSKKKALSNARTDLAAQIEIKVSGLIDNYLKSIEQNNNEEVVERYENMWREAYEQILKGTRTFFEKLVKTQEGKYKTYIAIELSGDELFNAMNKRLSEDTKLKIDYNYEKFKKSYKEEMKKLEQERGN